MTTRTLPIDREHLAALRAIRAAFGEVAVVGVERNADDPAEAEQLCMDVSA